MEGGQLDGLMEAVGQGGGLTMDEPIPPWRGARSRFG